MPKRSPKKKKPKHALLRRRPEKPFPFIDLPPELRDMIYEMAFTDVNGISLETRTKAYRRTVCRAPIFDSDECLYSWRRHPNAKQTPKDGAQDFAPKVRDLVPNLLAVSKQIHNEAVDILYGQDFIFRDTDALHRFLAIIGLRNQKRLRSIDIKSFCMGRNSKTLNHCAFMSLAAATNLKTLRLNNDEFRYHANPKAFARGIYRDAHHFLEAYGIANGRRDAAIDIMQLDDDVFDSLSPYRRRGDVTKLPTAEDNRVIFRKELCRLLAGV